MFSYFKTSKFYARFQQIHKEVVVSIRR